MEGLAKNAAAKTPVKDSHGSRSKNHDSSKLTENFNPNVSSSSSSPVVKKCSSSYKSQKPSASKKPNNPVAHSPHNKIRQRKFVVAKKKNPKNNLELLEGEGEDDGLTTSFCKCKEKKIEGSDGKKKSKCFCVAYENLRKSQEDFFKNKRDSEEKQQQEEEDAVGELGNSSCDLNAKRRRDRVVEEVRESAPQNGSGKVMNLVKAFEKLLKEPEEENGKKVMKWEVPVMQFSTAPETEVSGSSFCPPQLILTSENLGLDPRASVSSSWDSSRGSVSSRTSTGGRRSRRNSLESSSTFGGRKWKKKQPRVTSQKPFKLRTEQRGKLKEEEFEKKIQEMMTEEEKQRIPIAQGLPLTTDEPECLIKPPVKESTRPIDLKLCSDVRAMDRAEFDNQVAEKLILIEQYKLERERRKMLAEDEEVKRLRKELIPKAQPMPYFDRPFIPRRSVKHPTIPRVHLPDHKKIKCSVVSSWNDVNPFSSYLD